MTAHHIDEDYKLRIPDGFPASDELITLEQWDALPEAKQPHELVKGRIIWMAPTKYAHGRGAHRIGQLLELALSPKFWQVVWESGATIETEFPPTVRQPDVQVLRTEGFDLQTRRSSHGEAGLVVEVLSPSTRKTDLREKRAEYATASIGRYWIIDVKEQSSELLDLRLKDGVYHETRVSLLPGKPVVLDLSDLEEGVSLTLSHDQLTTNGRWLPAQLS